MARNPKQDANLKPPFDSNQSREEASKNGRKGGVKSGEVRRKNREARDAARFVLNLAAKGQLKANLEELGYTKEDVKSNMDALHARLFTMAMAGDIEAYKTLMKYAGYDPKEIRDERESLASDHRREVELEAKLNALGQAPEGSSMAVNMGSEDGASDVVIYIPKMLSEEDCKAEGEPETTTEGEATQEPADS